jgi:hypothetical protein
VRLEAEAVLGLIALTRDGEPRWVGRNVLEFESSRNPGID